MNPTDEFSKYALKHAGISSMTMHRYISAQGYYISPTIIEEGSSMWPPWMYFRG